MIYRLIIYNAVILINPAVRLKYFCVEQKKNQINKSIKSFSKTDK